MGTNVAPILFKNVKMNGVAIRTEEQLRRAGYEVYAPVKFEP
jgi:hypothetical protein